VAIKTLNAQSKTALDTAYLTYRRIFSSEWIKQIGDAISIQNGTTSARYQRA
jgi:hypothetical protein